MSDTRAGDGTADTRAGDGTADTRAGDGTADTEPERPHARDRVGVIAGVLLGLLTLFFLIALAAMGFQPALGLLVVFSVGALLVAGGVRLHGPRR